MKKFEITLDLSKIDKNRIINRTYKNKDGVDVTVKEYKLDVVELALPKTIKEGDTWTLAQTHFVTDAPTKEERTAKAKMNTLGKGVGFLDKKESQEDYYPEDDINPSEIPF